MLRRSHIKSSYDTNPAKSNQRGLSQLWYEIIMEEYTFTWFWRFRRWCIWHDSRCFACSSISYRCLLKWIVSLVLSSERWTTHYNLHCKKKSNHWILFHLLSYFAKTFWREFYDIRGSTSKSPENVNTNRMLPIPQNKSTVNSVEVYFINSRRFKHLNLASL